MGWKQKRWQNYTRKPTVESATAFKISDLTRAHIIPLPDGKSAIHANLTTPDGTHLTLSVKNLSSVDAWVIHVTYVGTMTRIPVAKTPLNFGGFRYWFICPQCMRRCGIVYITERRKTFACRKCCGLVYASTQARHTPPTDTAGGDYLGMVIRLGHLVDQLANLENKPISKSIKKT